MTSTKAHPALGCAPLHRVLCRLECTRGAASFTVAGHTWGTWDVFSDLPHYFKAINLNFCSEFHSSESEGKLLLSRDGFRPDRAKMLNSKKNKK